MTIQEIRYRTLGNETSGQVEFRELFESFRGRDYECPACRRVAVVLVNSVWRTGLATSAEVPIPLTEPWSIIHSSITFSMRWRKKAPPFNIFSTLYEADFLGPRFYDLSYVRTLNLFEVCDGRIDL